jgi:hypothetical protein
VLKYVIHSFLSEDCFLDHWHPVQGAHVHERGPKPPKLESFVKGLEVKSEFSINKSKG